MCKDLISKYGHIHRYWGLGRQHIFWGRQFNPRQHPSTLFKPLSCSTSKEPSRLEGKAKTRRQQEKPAWKSLWARWMAGDEVRGEQATRGWLWSPVIKLSLVRSHSFNPCLHVSSPVSSPTLLLFGISEESSSFSQGWKLQHRTWMWTCRYSTHRPQRAPSSTSRGQLQGLTLIQTIKFRSLGGIHFWLGTLRKHISGCIGRAISGLRSYPDKPQARAVRTQAISTHLFTQKGWRC